MAMIEKLKKRKASLEAEFAKGQKLLNTTATQLENIRGAIAFAKELIAEHEAILEEATNGSAAGCGQERVLGRVDAGTVEVARDGEPVKD